MNFKLWRTVGVIKDVRRGSALLVVLGMLAFMLFSGLAFSVYMRQSRLPSSFLRRTSSTRLLAKAALAEAMDEIDRAIGNDPHPGVRARGKSYQNGLIDNVWSHRVFFGWAKGNVSNGDDYEFVQSPDKRERSGDDAIWYVDPEEELRPTESTLTLEGLAYLPPNLINEARYYSQRTPTSRWHSFWFDSGRYAYTAIDVSDYFDVNRMLADKPRAACGSRRLSLAHIFEEGADHAKAGNGTDEWKKFMETYRVVNQDDDTLSYKKYPFVSLAAFNLAWMEESKGIGFKNNSEGSITSPFLSFLKSSDGLVYNCGDQRDSPDAEPYRCMTFVTDSWYPTTTGNLTPITKREKRDLTAYQPFRESEMGGSSMPSLGEIVEGRKFVSPGNNGADLAKHLSALGYVQLWDYLDCNRVPVSLAVPTVERVPMIVGIEPTLPSINMIEKRDPAADQKVDETEKERTYRRTVDCYLSLEGTLAANVLAAYPFRQHGISDAENFEIGGRCVLFLTKDGQNMKLRFEGNNDALRLKKATFESQQNSVMNKAVLSFPLQQQNISTSTILNDDAKPVTRVGLRGTVDGIGQIKMFRVVYQWVKEIKNEDGGWDTVKPDPAFEDIVKDDSTLDFYVLNANGEHSIETIADMVEALKSGGVRAKVNAAIWTWVRYNDPIMGKKIVDLVPARVSDDDELNGAHNDGGLPMASEQVGYPLMRYDVNAGNSGLVEIKTTVDGSQNAMYELRIEKPKLFVNDPRYNHLPENWYSVPGENINAEEWISETQKMLGTDGDCDADIFMFTSDQGIMQSVYELAYLSRFTDLSSQQDNYVGNQNRSAYDLVSFATEYTAVLDYKSMWRTYRCYGAGDEVDGFEEIGLTCGENGPKVNPYSDSTKVLMAAFANTPYDWRLASTNNEDVVDLTAKDFNEKYAWNDYPQSKKEKICWDCLEAIAEEFQAKVRKDGDWEVAFADLAWSKKKNKIIDFEEVDFDEDADSPMYGVDKKFLYGFWHDCFAARQQLFLIFVRAEPMMMGGGVSGQVPPQLSSRAVALVWRDPTTTGTRNLDGKNVSSPHHMRILFYHQFD